MDIKDERNVPRRKPMKLKDIPMGWFRGSISTYTDEVFLRTDADRAVLAADPLRVWSSRDAIFEDVEILDPDKVEIVIRDKE